jgi:hypothetical protein
MDAEHGRHVLRRWESLARLHAPVGDVTADLRCDMLVQRKVVCSGSLDIPHGDMQSITIMVQESTLTEDRPVSPERPEAVVREARRRQHHRWMAGISIAVVALLGVAVVIQVVARSPGGPTPPGAAVPRQPSGRPVLPAPPSQVVAWIQTSNATMSIQVIATKTGRVVRTLATDDGLFNSTPQPSVSPSGTVYYDNAIGGSAPPNPGPFAVEQIMSVPLSGGMATIVADGHDPQISPDGRLLAYLSFTQISGLPESVVVKNLASGATDSWQFSTMTPDINRMSWSPDSSSLVVSTNERTGQTWNLEAKSLVLADPSRSLDALPRIPLPQCPSPGEWAPTGTNRDMAWAGFLTSTEGIGECHHFALNPQDSWTQPVVISLATGRIINDLSRIPGLMPQIAGGGFQIDATGHYLLFIGNGHGAGGLYRWTLGGHPLEPLSRPVLVRNGVANAAWVPAQLNHSSG